MLRQVQEAADMHPLIEEHLDAIRALCREFGVRKRATIQPGAIVLAGRAGHWAWWTPSLAGISRNNVLTPH
jgi:monoamine oxidase